MATVTPVFRTSVNFHVCMAFSSRALFCDASVWFFEWYVINCVDFFLSLLNALLANRVLLSMNTWQPGFSQQCWAWRHITFSTLKIVGVLSSKNGSRSLYVIARPSVVCLSSVTFVCPTQAIKIFGNVSTLFGTFATHSHPGKILRRSSQGNPSVGGVKHNRGSRI